MVCVTDVMCLCLKVEMCENTTLFKEGYVLKKNIMEGPHKKGMYLQVHIRSDLAVHLLPVHTCSGKRQAPMETLLCLSEGISPLSGEG